MYTCAHWLIYTCAHWLIYTCAHWLIYLKETVCDNVCMLSGYVSVTYLPCSSSFHLLTKQFYVGECAVRKIKIV